MKSSFQCFDAVVLEPELHLSEILLQ